MRFLLKITSSTFLTVEHEHAIFDNVSCVDLVRNILTHTSYCGLATGLSGDGGSSSDDAGRDMNTPLSADC